MARKICSIFAFCICFNKQQWTKTHSEHIKMKVFQDAIVFDCGFIKNHSNCIKIIKGLKIYFLESFPELFFEEPKVTDITKEPFVALIVLIWQWNNEWINAARSTHSHWKSQTLKHTLNYMWLRPLTSSKSNWVTSVESHCWFRLDWSLWISD